MLGARAARIGSISRSAMLAATRAAGRLGATSPSDALPLYLRLPRIPWETLLAAAPPGPRPARVDSGTRLTKLIGDIGGSDWVVPVGPIFAAFGLLVVFNLWLLSWRSHPPEQMTPVARVMTANPRATLAIAFSVTAVLCAAVVLLTTL